MVIEIIEIKTWRDPYDSGFSPTQPQKIVLEKGVTVLVGCNGAGKSTLLHNIRDEAKQQEIPVHMFDNLNDGGHNLSSMLFGVSEFECDSLELGTTMFCSSEGENIHYNIVRQSTLHKEFIETGYFKNRSYHFSNVFKDKNELKEITDKRRILMFDATDSGLSIDNIILIKDYFHTIINDAENSGYELYIIISANEYEMTDNENCFDVNSGKYLRFENYLEYKKFILKSRTRKEKRIENQMLWHKKHREKALIKLDELKVKNEEYQKSFLENTGKSISDLHYVELREYNKYIEIIEDFERTNRFITKEDIEFVYKHEERK